MPKDTIERATKRGAGELEGVNYEEIRYEGYGINGAAVIVDCMTDNRTRTVADVRHAFSKYGGNLGTDGSVAFLFKHCGQIVFAPGTDEDKLMEAAIDAGAEDVVSQRRRQHRGRHRSRTISSRSRTRSPRPGFKPEFAEVTMKPLDRSRADGRRRARRCRSSSTRSKSLDDVQEVYTSAVIDELSARAARRLAARRILGIDPGLRVTGFGVHRARAATRSSTSRAAASARAATSLPDAPRRHRCATSRT